MMGMMSLVSMVPKAARLDADCKRYGNILRAPHFAWISATQTLWLVYSTSPQSKYPEMEVNGSATLSLRHHSQACKIGEATVPKVLKALKVPKYKSSANLEGVSRFTESGELLCLSLSS
jgi:hypothetical protein